MKNELEEARDTIERLVAEKIGITRQRDEMKRQLDIAISENLTLRQYSRSQDDREDDFEELDENEEYYWDGVNRPTFEERYGVPERGIAR